RLLATLGDRAEVEAMARVAAASPKAETLLALGLSGRPPALERCLGHLDHAEHGAVARRAFSLVTGHDGTGDAEALHGWWQRERARFDDDRRYRDGHLLEAGALRRLLGAASPDQRPALVDELRIRSGGRLVLVDPRLAPPEAWRRCVDALDDAVLGTIDLEAGFPWTAAS
ncbi:MAG: hypothetical protein KC431_24940, partial [Myxococcales bacterium]|nr:hypothetical protein [Myxococcales bacterium]